MNHLSVSRPDEGVFAFYDGRIPGYRSAAERNWVDEGALSLGIASYAIADGGEALVYDTHVSVEHARIVRNTLAAAGVDRFTVVLSHWHLDHIAGTEAFADCEVIACERTAEQLAARRAAIESGTESGPPAIDPLIMPTSTFPDRMELQVGRLEAELIHLNIHSDDAVVVSLPERRLLLAGDTLEDPITYVDAPEALDAHLTDLARLAELEPEAVLPNHGDPEVIAAGGYPAALIDATRDYVRKLQRCRTEPELRAAGLEDFVAESLAAGSINYFEAYEAVHRSNVETVVAFGA